MHVHSTFSDGTFNVDMLARAAKKRHLSLICLTDHDTTAGLSSFSAACAREGVEHLGGIELSADAPCTLHILGYRVSPGNRRLETRLDDIRRFRGERNLKICSKLNELGMDITMDEVEAVSGGQVVARPHFARVMIKKGYASSISEAFTKYLGFGALAYVPRVRLSAEESITLINGAGGLAVLAHPLQTKLDDCGLRKLLSRLKDAGLWGIEAVYGSHSPEDIYRFLSLGSEFGLYATAGSDFHGQSDRGVDLGLPVSEDFLPWARLGLKF